MHLLTFDNVLVNPDAYVKDALSIGFKDFQDGDKVFKNIQQRGDDDELCLFLEEYLPSYEVASNIIRLSPLNQVEPNYIHKDDMMGDITVILYLSKEHPKEDGTTIYDDNMNPVCRFYSKFNRMVAFESDCNHSRNIFENFGDGESSRLIQVVFLKQKK